jgi:hypothetical protein
MAKLKGRNDIKPSDKPYTVPYSRDPKELLYRINNLITESIIDNNLACNSNKNAFPTTPLVTICQQLRNVCTYVFSCQPGIGAPSSGIKLLYLTNK